MSNPYGPAIETVEDWNATLACCCAIPVPDAPTMLCEAKAASVSKFGAAPYVKPAGVDTAKIPTLYENFDWPQRSDYTGTAALYIGWWLNSGTGTYFESLQVLTVNETWQSGVGGINNNSNATTGNAADDDTFSPITDTFSDTVTPYESNTFSYYFLNSVLCYGDFTPTVTPTYTITATVFKQEIDTHYASGGSRPALQGAGGTADLFIHYADVHELTKGEMTLKDPFTEADLRTAATAAANAQSWAATGGCSSTFSMSGWPLIGDPDYSILTLDHDGYNNAYSPNWFGVSISMDVRLVRYRWRVPSTHLGTYYKVTWDVLYEPVGWDDEDIPEAERPIRFSRKDLTVEWTGPGSGAQSDPSWLAGDWQTLEVPDEPGVRKVINVRFTHFQDGP